MRKTASFLFVVLNGTWALMTYMLHVVGVRPAVIATVAAIGLLLGNLALYSGVHLPKELLGQKDSLNQALTGVVDALEPPARRSAESSPLVN